MMSSLRSKPSEPSRLTDESSKHKWETERFPSLTLSFQMTKGSFTTLDQFLWSTVVELQNVNLPVLISGQNAWRGGAFVVRSSFGSITGWRWMICEAEFGTTGSSGSLLFFVVTEPTAIFHADGASTYSSTRSPSPPSFIKPELMKGCGLKLDKPE